MHLGVNENIDKASACIAEAMNPNKGVLVLLIASWSFNIVTHIFVRALLDLEIVILDEASRGLE